MSLSYVTITTGGKTGRLFVGVAGALARADKRKLVWFEECPSARQARQRGAKIKGWRRDCKVALITRRNPGWKDLSRIRTA